MNILYQDYGLWDNLELCQMSELRIALIAEGATDLIIIEAALKAIIKPPFILNLLQPEATRPDIGGGWCGVVCSNGRIHLSKGASMNLKMIQHWRFLI